MCARYFNANDKEDLDYTLKLIKNHSLGCVQVPLSRMDIMEKVLAVADYPIIIITDMEMGYPNGKLPKIPLMTLAACDNDEYYRAFARGTIYEAKRDGYNSMWGPVLDVLQSDGPCSVHRHFSDNAERVGEAAQLITQVCKENNFLTCGKHFPGGEEVTIDLHMSNTPSGVSREKILNLDLVPYKHLMQKGLLPSIMTSHRIFSSIDPEHPASLSKKVNDIIREAGFDGLCFTDSMAMMAILQEWGEENILGMAVAAGNDIVLPNYRTTNKNSFELLKRNYFDGAFSEERLNEAVRRVLTVQKMLGTEPSNPLEFTADDRKKLDNVAKDCITAICDDDTTAALDTESKKLFVIITENNFEKEIAEEVCFGKWYNPTKIAEKIRKEFPNADIEFLPEFPNALDNERILLSATRHTEVVLVTYCATGPYLGTDCLTRRAEYLINSLIGAGKVSAVLHFGNPFAVKKLLHTKRRLFGYMMADSQIYAIDVLAGKLPAKGKLPFNIDYV
ncbi:MAG: hypothetical protein J6Q76_01960, partial [Clostridia bacterium]|nr:hypothetical protein [Clostridia bacterium]